MIPFIDLREEYRTIEPEVSESLREVFSRGSFILGESVNRFETEFAQFCGVRFAVGVGSGTEALHLSLLAAGVKPGEEVITVSNTAAATALAQEWELLLKLLVEAIQRQGPELAPSGASTSLLSGAAGRFAPVAD